MNGTTGPVRDIVAEPEYLDITLPPATRFSRKVRNGYMAAVYVIEGSGVFDPADKEEMGNRTLALFSTNGDFVEAHSGKSGCRFLFFSGKPLREPIAWGGPIVMNTQEELEQAFSEYQQGTFIRKSS